MLLVDPDSKMTLEHALVGCSLDDVASVVDKGHVIQVVLPCFGDECELADSLEFSGVHFTRVGGS